MKIEKGAHGYVQSQKKIRLVRTIGIFGIDFALFFFGLYMNDGSRRNIYSIIAAVGCIPGAMALISFIMMAMRHPTDEKICREVKARTEGLISLYELYITTEKKNLFLDATVIAGEYLISYTSEQKPQTDISFIEKHLRAMLRDAGFPGTVKIFSDYDKFLERIEDLEQKKDSFVRKTDGAKAEALKNLAL